MNAGASLHRGIKVSLKQWLWGKRENDKCADFSAVMNLSYSLNRFSFLEFIEGENDFSGNQLPGIPESFFAGSIDLKAAFGLHFQIEVVSSGKIPLNDFNSRFTDPWTVLNTKAGYSVSLNKKWRVDGMISLNNIADIRYASMVVVNAPGTESRPPRYYYPGMPRWFTFTIGMNYRFLKG